MILIYRVQRRNLKICGSFFFLLTVMLFSSLTVFAAEAGSAVQKSMELTLDQAVNMALINNPTGKIAVFDFEAAKGSLTAARSYRWPTISATHKDAWTWHGEKYNDKP
ncbi:MAG: TolC family protein [Negativicutes bacterium]